MDKQELLSVLGERIVKEDKEITDVSDWINGYYCGRFDALTFAYERVKWIDEPEKPEIPHWLAERTEEYNIDSSVKFWRYVFNGSIFDPEERAWILDNDDIINKMFLCGYTVKEPVWVVLKDAQYFHAFTGEYDESKGFEYVLAMYEGHAHTFTDKQKAEAAATLVDGTVKEWSE